MSKLLSEKVKKIPPTEVSPGRYEFIKLAEVEPDLGVPAGNNYILSSDTNGNRTWINSSSISASVQYIFVANNYTAANGESIVVDTDSGIFTISLPSSPIQGDTVVVLDGGTSSNSEIIVDAGIESVENTANSIILDVPNIKSDFIYDGTTWQVFSSVGSQGPQGEIGFTGSRGAPPRWTLITADYDAQDNDRLIADTTGGTFTITLPESANTGDYVQITDGGNFSSIPVIVHANNATIEGVNDDVSLDVGGATYEFIYSVDTWQITATAGPTGFTGSAGPNNIINAEEDTTTTSLYPVMVDDSGNTAIAKVSSSKFFFDANTGILSVTELNAFSDQTLKDDIIRIDGALEFLENIEGVEFKWKDTGRKSYGVIAQQVEEMIPSLINNVEHKSVNYNGIIAFLIEAIKQLNERMKEIQDVQHKTY